MGFAHVEAGPLVRSSYRADRQLMKSRAAKAVARGTIGYSFRNGGDGG